MFGPNSSTRTILQLRCTKLDCSVVGQARGSESSSFHNLPKPPALSEGFPQGLLMPKEEGAQNEPHPQILGEEPHLKKKRWKNLVFRKTLVTSMEDFLLWWHFSLIRFYEFRQLSAGTAAARGAIIS